MIKQHDWNLKKQHQTTRLIEKKTELIIRKKQNYTCKRCFVKFDNNIKLYEHVRTKHNKKSKKFINEKKFFSFFVTITLIISFFSFFSFVTSFMSSIFLHVTTSATLKNSISWIEVVSRSKFIIFSRLSRLTIKYNLFTSSFFSHLSSILKISNLINNIAKKLFITTMKSHLIVKNLYRMFHEKLKFSSFFIMQTRLHFVFFLIKYVFVKCASQFISNHLFVITTNQS